MKKHKRLSIHEKINSRYDTVRYFYSFDHDWNDYAKLHKMIKGQNPGLLQMIRRYRDIGYDYVYLLRHILK
jgi:hypothetical protein